MIAENNALEEAIVQLKAKGYTLTFSPDDAHTAAWGVAGPWPTDIEYHIDEEISCRVYNDGEETRIRVLAITTKPFGLKGFQLVNAEQQRYWTVDEILISFSKMLQATKTFLFSSKAG